ncbi:hypothetical protein LEP1GSC050_3006 [Leptospira broomii serovar Hurstbridge str. 5399]|uniref:Uncharacterized protein n=1 Tax=Leptospira broomii serovar Hurstbridge str. 5399 TaxID=1049789 RepID=T0GHR8_9LEPT|nr:hypothetical protein LEP1GSC050_3006 [Leptospira broomii serovar Hurstbridge str. 5399]
MLNLKNVLQERDIYDISQSLIRLGTSTSPAPAQKGGDHSKKLPHSEYLAHRTIQTNRRTNFRSLWEFQHAKFKKRIARKRYI